MGLEIYILSPQSYSKIIEVSVMNFKETINYFYSDTILSKLQTSE